MAVLKCSLEYYRQEKEFSWIQKVEVQKIQVMFFDSLVFDAKHFHKKSSESAIFILTLHWNCFPGVDKCDCGHTERLEAS